MTAEQQQNPFNSSRTLFGEVALRMAKSPEDIATESVCFMLTQYEAARQYFHKICEQTGVTLPEHLNFQTQDASEGHRPDLLGTDSNGNRRIVVESKFWAGLTQNQPTTYLNSMPGDQTAVLLFILPALRFRTLWPKLKCIAADGGFEVTNDRHVFVEFQTCDIAPHHRLGQISWRRLIKGLRDAGEDAGNSQLVEDAGQLLGLCERMDGQSFTPLTPDDLSPMIGRRVQQYCELIGDVVQELKNKHKASTERLTTGGKGGEYGRYFRLEGIGLFFAFSPAKWASMGESPLWLTISWINDAKHWITPPELRDAIRLRYPDDASAVNAAEISIPIHPSTGVERDDLIADLCDQIRQAVKVSQNAMLKDTPGKSTP